MIDIKGLHIEELPITDLKKVTDLLEYEGPILSHFIDNKNRDYLFYWVDYDEVYNRWLVWRVTKQQLNKYLIGDYSLRQLLLNPNRDYTFSVDIDKKLRFENVKMIDIDNLETEYIPEKESFYEFDVPKEYKALIEPKEVMYKNELISLREDDLYLFNLRQKAIYFTIEPRTLEHATTVSALDAANFLKNITNSFRSFIGFNFVERFKNTISDLEKLNKTANKFKDILIPRVVDLQYSSFKVALSTDTYKSADYKEYTEWQRSVLDTYKDDVIEIDYNSEDDIKKITSKYPDTVRRAIYSPIVNIINDKKYKVNIQDYQREYTKSYKEIKKKNTEILIPKLDLIEEEHDKKLVNIIVEIDDDADIKKVGKKEIQEGLLFSQVESSNIKIKEFIHYNTTLILKSPLRCELHVEGKTCWLKNDDFDIEVKGEHATEVKNDFNAKFIELYMNLREDKTEQNKKLKEKLLSNVQEFIKNE